MLQIESLLEWVKKDKKWQKKHLDKLFDEWEKSDKTGDRAQIIKYLMSYREGMEQYATTMIEHLQEIIKTEQEKLHGSNT